MNPNYTTDGPWSSDSEFVSSPDGFIAQVVERDTPRETEANGRLIASAPDLLAACEAVVNDCDAILDGDDMSGMSDQELFSAIRRTLTFAIFKAKGGAA